MVSTSDEAIQLLKYLHIINTSMYYSIHKVIGKGSGGVMKLTLDQIGEHELPLMSEYLSGTSKILGLDEFSCSKENENYSVIIKGCVWNHVFHKSLNAESTCPLVLIAASIIKKEGTRNIKIDEKYGAECIRASITESPVFETHMNSSIDLLKYFYLLNVAMQYSLWEVTGKAIPAVMRLSVERISQFELPSVSKYISITKNILKLTEFTCKKGNYKEGVAYSVRIRGCPFVSSVHESFKPGMICPLLHILAGIIKKENNVHVEVEMTLEGDGITGKVNLCPESWVEVLRLSKNQGSGLKAV
ncbi:MAG: hypothetical protein KAQ85_04605, partial [Thermodesulfovibrionia bacterium]|nr:hypothetical protein [Thermodesulfovibrionia bacterium]